MGHLVRRRALLAAAPAALVTCRSSPTMLDRNPLSTVAFARVNGDGEVRLQQGFSSIESTGTGLMTLTLSEGVDPDQAIITTGVADSAPGGRTSSVHVKHASDTEIQIVLRAVTFAAADNGASEDSDQFGFWIKVEQVLGF